jgi:hypothetical protein
MPQTIVLDPLKQPFPKNRISMRRPRLLNPNNYSARILVDGKHALAVALQDVYVARICAVEDDDAVLSINMKPSEWPRVQAFVLAACATLVEQVKCNAALWFPRSNVPMPAIEEYFSPAVVVELGVGAVLKVRVPAGAAPAAPGRYNMRLTLLSVRFDRTRFCLEWDISDHGAAQETESEWWGAENDLAHSDGHHTESDDLPEMPGDVQQELQEELLQSIKGVAIAVEHHRRQLSVPVAEVSALQAAYQWLQGQQATGTLQC